MARYEIYERRGRKGFTRIGADETLDITCNRVVNDAYMHGYCTCIIYDTARNNGKYTYDPEYSVILGCMIENHEPVVYIGDSNTDFFNEVAQAFVYKDVIIHIVEGVE